MTPTEVERRYKQRTLRLMEALAAKAGEAGLEAGKPWAHCLDGSLRVELTLGSEPNRIDLTFRFCFSEHWDGEKGGLNFSLDAVHEDGSMITGLTPYNYSDRVWVPRKDAQAVEERFRLMEASDLSSLVQVVKDWRAAHLAP